MIRAVAQLFAVWLAASVTGSGAVAVEDKAVTWTGWFSDAQCAAPRVARGLIGPNNTDCVKRCIEDGATPVFISEQAKALFEIKDYPSVKDDVGFHVELTGTVDDAAKTIAVQSVKRLSNVGALCARPKKTNRKN